MRAAHAFTIIAATSLAGAIGCSSQQAALDEGGHGRRLEPAPSRHANGSPFAERRSDPRGPAAAPAFRIAEPRMREPSHPGDRHQLKRLDLRDTPVVHALRLIAEKAGLNAVATDEAGRKAVTIFLQDVTAIEAIETLCKVSDLWYRRDEGGSIRVMTTEQYQKDLVVYRRDQTKVIQLQFPNVLTAAQAIEDLYGDRVILSFGVDGDELLFSGASSGVGLGGGGFGNQGGFGNRGNFGGNGFNGGANGGFGNRGGSFSRSVNGGGGSRFGRSGNGARSGRSGGVRRGSGAGQESDRLLDEDLTSDQIARLEAIMRDGGELGAAALADVSRRDPPVYVTVNREHNLLLLRSADERALGEIERLVAQIDRPTPQVLLEMKILELTMGDTFRSIFDFSFQDGDPSAGPDDGQAANPLSGAAIAAQDILGAGNFGAEGGSFVYQFLDDRIRARVQMLQRDNKVEVISTPTVLASNNRPARVFVGEERVLVTGVNTDVIVAENGTPITTVEPITEVRDVGNSLIILPKINADGSVTLLVTQDVSSVIPQSSAIPVANAAGGIDEFLVDSVQTSQVEGVVVAQNELTVAIGGLIRTEVTDVEEKIPLLGDIPLLGIFFRDEDRRRVKTELVLLITPHVIRTPNEGVDKTRELLDRTSRHGYHEEGDALLEEHFEREDEVLEEDNPFDRSSHENYRRAADGLRQRND